MLLLSMRKHQKLKQKKKAVTESDFSGLRLCLGPLIVPGDKY